MKIKILNWLLIIDILTLLLILGIVIIPSSVIRIIIGLPFLLFFPGYVLISALFPPKSAENTTADNKKGMDPIERVALSFGMSIALVALIGLGLNYTPWGIRLLPILLSISVFIIILSLIAMFRQYRSLKQLRLTTELNLKLPGWEGSTLNKTLTVILALAILGAIGVLAYTIAVPKVGERFTEFYILGNNGKAEGYPSLFVMNGEQVVSVQYGNSGANFTATSGNVTLGIVNHEQQETSYSATITVDGQPARINYAGNKFDTLENIDLPQDGKWEKVISFSPQHTGDNQKVEFLLYKNGATEPENTLHLWVNVKAQ